MAWELADHRRFLGLIAESMATGWSIKDPNRSVTVLAWPVAALAGRRLPFPGARKRVDQEFRALIARITRTLAGEPGPSSRADALQMHVDAFSPTRPDLRAGLLGRLVEECRNLANRKRELQLEEASLVIALDDPEAAIALASSLKEGRRLRTLSRIEGDREGLGPRRFFRAVEPPRSRTSG